jgi:hypothetical protein
VANVAMLSQGSIWYIMRRNIVVFYTLYCKRQYIVANVAMLSQGSIWYIMRWRCVCV